jgi:hypothetical protein
MYICTRLAQSVERLTFKIKVIKWSGVRVPHRVFIFL